MSASAAALLGDNTRQVVRDSEERNAPFVERRQNELAHLPFRHWLSRCRIDDLPQEMILGDVLHVALGEALSPETPGPITSVNL